MFVGILFYLWFYWLVYLVVSFPAFVYFWLGLSGLFKLWIWVLFFRVLSCEFSKSILYKRDIQSLWTTSLFLFNVRLIVISIPFTSFVFIIVVVFMPLVALLIPYHHVTTVLPVNLQRPRCCDFSKPFSPTQKPSDTCSDRSPRLQAPKKR